ncbi:MAG: EamA family transporter RarD [Pseudomonadota bacterium]
MNQTSPTDNATVAREGVIAALLAYGMWGCMPVYFKLVAQVESLEVLAHRIIWAVPFGLIIILARRQGREVLRALATGRTLGLLALAAIFIAINWLVYIRAVQTGNIFQASLGYYINPLVYVLAGVVMFGERLSTLQLASVVLAAAGVVVLSFSGDTFPAISLILAVSFTIYGVIRKYVEISGMAGLFIETLVLFPMALAWLGYGLATESSAFSMDAPGMVGLLLLAGPVTVLPLLMFALAARRLRLTTLGFMQFLAPTMQFGMGVLYGEVLTSAYVVCFACIWAAVVLFIVDALRR